MRQPGYAPAPACPVERIKKFVCLSLCNSKISGSNKKDLAHPGRSLTEFIHSTPKYLNTRLKGKCYGSNPVVISLQLTNFQSLISLRMNHIIFREDPKSHLPVSRTCTLFKYTITANGKNYISGEKIHFL